MYCSRENKSGWVVLLVEGCRQKVVPLGLPKPTTPEHRVLSSEDAGHRDWRNVRKNNIQNTAKEPKKPTTTIRSQP